MKIRSLFVISFLFLVLASAQALAATHYVRAGAAGNGSGADWTNAYPSFTAAGLCGNVSTAPRGHTYYVADGEYGACLYTNNVDADKNFIIIKHANAADHGDAPDWDPSYGDEQAVFTDQQTIRRGYYIFDGNSETSYGFKRVSGALPQYAGFYIDWTTGVTDFERHTLRSIEVDMSESTCCLSGEVDAVFNNGSPNSTFDHLSIRAYGDAMQMDHGADNCVINNVYFERAPFPASCTDHSDALSTVNLDDITITNCVFNWDGQQIWLAGDIDPYTNSNWQISGNLFFGGKSAQSICRARWVGAENSRIYNNTFYDVFRAIEDFDPPLTGDVRNNIFYGYILTPQFGDATHDYNYYGLGSDVTEPHGINSDADPFVDKANHDFHLAISPMTGDPTIGPAYNIDKDGRVRGGDGVWDIGAYEYVEGGPYLAVTAPSANTIWRLGTSHNITWAYNELTGNVTIDWYKSGTSQAIVQNVSIANGSYSWPIPMDLTPGNDYFIKISSGTSEADSGIFSILAQEAPLAQTNSATAITTTSAVLNGTVNAHGLATTYYFEYGTTTSYGSSTIVTNAGSGENNVSVPVTISGLTANTIYHFRLMATNSLGTTEGNDMTFTTSSSGGGGEGDGSGDSGGGGGGGCFINTAGQGAGLRICLLSLFLFYLCIYLNGWGFGKQRAKNLKE